MHPADDNALNTEEKIWDLTMQINAKGVWWGCKYAILAMRENPTDESKGLHTGGSIINTASFVASMGAATPQLACKFTAISHSLSGSYVLVPYRYCLQSKPAYIVSRDEVIDLLNFFRVQSFR
jgi:NAD(P)-dependent dehydrogenase (short-subunit alcohol dehydrogenase family)